MFSYVLKFGNDLMTFLNKLNPNIDWSKFISTNIGLSDEKFIKKIKPLLWTDKDYETTLGWFTTNSQNFYYYCKYVHVLRKFGKVDILDVPEDTNDISGFIISELRAKLRVLQQVCKFNNIKYELVTTDCKSHILIPTCSILYDSVAYKQLASKYQVICHDPYFNVYSEEQYDKLCNIQLILYLLAFDPDVNLSGATYQYEDSVDKLLNMKFNIIKVNGGTKS